MGDLERFLHADTPNIPVLVKAGLAHVQFETIHPFLDGNGRLGRLLITLFLCEQGVLRDPLLYLSSISKLIAAPITCAPRDHAKSTLQRPGDGDREPPGTERSHSLSKRHRNSLPKFCGLDIIRFGSFAS
jgi:Fic family protein